MNAETFAAIATELRRNHTLLSNCFFDRGALEEALSRPGTEVRRAEGLLTLLLDEPTLTRVYFYADGETALGRLPALLKDTQKQVVADVVGRDSRAKPLAERLLAAGFRYNSTFVRLVCKKPELFEKTVPVNAVEPANEADVPYMLPLLKTEFSPLYSHFPGTSEFLQAAHKGEITVVRENGVPVALAYFEDVSRRSKCLRYFIVDKSARGKGYGAALLNREFSRNDAEQEYYLWIGTYNPTQKLYAQVGFVHDGLMDYIVTLETNRGSAAQEEK